MPNLLVLHIDDDANDTALLQAAISRAGVHFQLHNIHDAEQTVSYLAGQGVYADRTQYPFPSLVLLDLKMPRQTGFEILRWIRSRPELAKLPVVILSGSELHEDIRLAYANGANSYLVKPLSFDALIAMVRELDLSWLAGASHTPRLS